MFGIFLNKRIRYKKDNSKDYENKINLYIYIEKIKKIK